MAIDLVEMNKTVLGSMNQNFAWMLREIGRGLKGDISLLDSFRNIQTQIAVWVWRSGKFNQLNSPSAVSQNATYQKSIQQILTQQTWDNLKSEAQAELAKQAPKAVEPVPNDGPPTQPPKEEPTTTPKEQPPQLTTVQKLAKIAKEKTPRWAAMLDAYQDVYYKKVSNQQESDAKQKQLADISNMVIKEISDALMELQVQQYGQYVSKIYQQLQMEAKTRWEKANPAPKQSGADPGTGQSTAGQQADPDSQPGSPQDPAPPYNLPPWADGLQGVFTDEQMRFADAGNRGEQEQIVTTLLRMAIEGGPDYFRYFTKGAELGNLWGIDTATIWAELGGPQPADPVETAAKATGFVDIAKKAGPVGALIFILLLFS